MSVKIEASGQEVLGFIDRICKGLEWLSSKQMYVWRLEYSVEKLEKARNELRDTMELAVGTMEEALNNGWWPLKPPARGWLREGLVITDHANKLLSLYKQKASGDSSTSVFLCPCEAVSWRTINARAIMRMNQILEHKSAGAAYEMGSFDDVACKRGADDQETKDPKAIRSLLKAQACLSLDDRIAALLAPPPVSPTPPSTLPTTQVANPSDGNDDAVAVLDSSISPVTPLPEVSGHHEAQIASGAEKVQLNAFTKYRAFARSQSYECVPVVIQVKAPRYTLLSRTPVDLVMVLDISGSMHGEPMGMLKMGAMFVVHNLEATDRLSIVVFSTNAKLLLPLSAMSDEAKSLTNSLIESLVAAGGTSLVPAMEVAYEVLRDRPDEDRVSGIILFTDGSLTSGRVEDINFVEKYPTYALGFGPCHDPRVLYSFTTRGHGTYSFAMEEGLESIKDAMALYIGGLTSIVAQDVGISVYSAHPDVRLSDIACGAYTGSIGHKGKSGSITVNDLCGNEEKNFIVYVNVPKEGADNFARTPKTKLLTVSASYYSPLIDGPMHADTVEIFADRPAKIRDQDHNVISAEVASEVTRANVFKGVGEIWRETSAVKDESDWPRFIEEKLQDLRDSISCTEEAKAAKDRWDDLRNDLDKMDMYKMAHHHRIENSLAYMLSWLSSHQWQRAATPGSTSKSKWFSFRTVRMQNMIDSVESAPSSFLRSVQWHPPLSRGS